MLHASCFVREGSELGRSLTCRLGLRSLNNCLRTLLHLCGSSFVWVNISMICVYHNSYNLSHGIGDHIDRRFTIRPRLRRCLCRRRLQRHHSKERATVLSPHNKQRATSATCKLGQFNSPPAELSEPRTNHLGGGGPYSHCCMVEDQAGDWRGRKPVTK